MGAGLAGEGSELHEPFSQDHSLDWEWSATLRPGFSSGFPGTSGPGGLRSSPLHPLPGVGSENNPFGVSCHFSTLVSVPSARYTLEFCYQLCHLVALSSVLMVFKSQEFTHLQIGRIVIPAVSLKSLFVAIRKLLT